MGAVRTRRLVASGHEVQLANSKRPDTVRNLARDVAAMAISKKEAVEGVETITLASRSASIPAAPGSRRPPPRRPSPWDGCSPAAAR
ncbi:NAD(P)-binding domain-containing protein [Mesorhizobium silamurunense]|uniref:NAD(P)-binding domain-containing protein n=1 Tax=Mesorhizobium silamurunense TaxID=499528 RepID=UPI0028A73579|nr:NAD(P)-binding domain-containing protein [Mesorhizobium silamurunense]